MQNSSTKRSVSSFASWLGGCKLKLQPVRFARQKCERRSLPSAAGRIARLMLLLLLVSVVVVVLLLLLSSSSWSWLHSYPYSSRSWNLTGPRSVLMVELECFLRPDGGRRTERGPSGQAVGLCLSGPVYLAPGPGSDRPRSCRSRAAGGWLHRYVPVGAAQVARVTNHPEQWLRR